MENVGWTWQLPGGKRMDRPRSIHVNCFEQRICNARMVRERVFIEVTIPSGILLLGAMSVGAMWGTWEHI